jgi:hypothetical protein
MRRAWSDPLEISGKLSDASRDQRQVDFVGRDTGCELVHFPLLLFV